MTGTEVLASGLLRRRDNIWRWNYLMHQIHWGLDITWHDENEIFYSISYLSDRDNQFAPENPRRSRHTYWNMDSDEIRLPLDNRYSWTSYFQNSKCKIKTLFFANLGLISCGLLALAIFTENSRQLSSSKWLCECYRCTLFHCNASLMKPCDAFLHSASLISSVYFVKDNAIENPRAFLVFLWRWTLWVELIAFSLSKSISGH